MILLGFIRKELLVASLWQDKRKCNVICLQTFVARLVRVISRTVWNLIKQSLLQPQVVCIMYHVSSMQKKSVFEHMINCFVSCPPLSIRTTMTGVWGPSNQSWLWLDLWRERTAADMRIRYIHYSALVDAIAHTVASRQPNVVFVHRCWCERCETSTSPR